MNMQTFGPQGESSIRVIEGAPSTVICVLFLKAHKLGISKKVPTCYLTVLWVRNWALHVSRYFYSGISKTEIMVLAGPGSYLEAQKILLLHSQFSSHFLACGPLHQLLSNVGLSMQPHGLLAHQALLSMGRSAGKDIRE